VDVGQSDIPAFKKAVVVVGGERDTQCTSKLQVYTLHVHRQLLNVLFLLYDNEKSYVNAGMSEKS
jgi:hypothetical protein